MTPEEHIASLQRQLREQRDDIHAEKARFDARRDRPQGPGLPEQIAGLDERLRGVEVAIGRLEGKIDALSGAG